MMKSEPKNIMILGASYTTKNMGVWTLASGTIESILHCYPGARIHLFDYGLKPADYEVKFSGGKKAVQLINIRFSKKVWLPNNIARLILTVLLSRCIPSRSLRKRSISGNYWLKNICKMDIVGSIAGGDSFSDIYGFERLMYVALP